MKKLIIFIPTLFLVFTISFSQVKYTSAGNFGIGTLTPTNAILEIKPTTSGNGILLNCGNYDIDFGLGNGVNYGYFWRYKGSGSGNNNTLQLWTDGQYSTDVKVYEIYQDGNMDFYSSRIDLFSESTANYAKTMVVYNKNRLLENYVVYERIDTNPDVWDQTFCVQGRGHVYCSAVTETSDISLKENITDVTNSIDIIKQLRPVKYNLKAEASLEEDERETDFGLIAQEVELILPEVISENSSGIKGINYREISVLLIDAVKQQATEIELLKSELSGLSESMKKSTSGLSDPSISEIEKSALFQNSPNPFNDATDIKYYIPQISNMSSINIYDLNGKMLDSYEIKSEGDGKITIPGSMLDAGMYFYNLIVDGVIIDTKQMVLTK